MFITKPLIQCQVIGKLIHVDSGNFKLSYRMLWLSILSVDYIILSMPESSDLFDICSYVHDWS